MFAFAGFTFAFLTLPASALGILTFLFLALAFLTFAFLAFLFLAFAFLAFAFPARPLLALTILTRSLLAFLFLAFPLLACASCALVDTGQMLVRGVDLLHLPGDFCADTRGTRLMSVRVPDLHKNEVTLPNLRG